MKVGVIITMYDESEIVVQTVRQIRNTFKDSEIILVHSDNKEVSGTLDTIKNLSSEYIKLPDMSDEIVLKNLNPIILRNLNTGFKKLYESNVNYDLIVVLTGDTLIHDPSCFIRRAKEMKKNEWIAMVSQAVGQDFHATAADGSCIFEVRHQSETTTDFACCLFFLNGEWALKHQAFSNIEMTNAWANEQCLGDEILKFLGDKDFHKHVGRLNSKKPKKAYSYNDGVIYHAMHDGKPAGRYL